MYHGIGLSGNVVDICALDNTMVYFSKYTVVLTVPNTPSRPTLWHPMVCVCLYFKITPWYWCSNLYHGVLFSYLNTPLYVPKKKYFSDAFTYGTGLVMNIKYSYWPRRRCSKTSRSLASSAESLVPIVSANSMMSFGRSSTGWNITFAAFEVHGFRRAFRDYFSNELQEMAIGLRQLTFILQAVLSTMG